LLYRIFSLRQPKTIIPAVVAVVTLIGYFLLHRQRSLRRGYGYLLIALTLAELLVLGWRYNPVMLESEMFPSVQGVEILKEDGEPFRIMTTDGIFWPNYPAAYGISDIAGYDLPVSARYSELYVAQGGVVDHMQVWHPDWPLLDFLNTKYVIASQELDPDRFDAVHSGTGFQIYQNRQAMPRAFMVYDIAVIENEAAMVDRVLSKEWEPGKTALLEEPLSPDELVSLGSEGSFSIDFVEYSNDNVVLEVFTEQSGLLVMSDLYSRDWQARVDAEQVELHRANFAYRAVYVPAGWHRIVFSYAPKAFTMGVVFTSVGLIVAGLLVLVGKRAPKPHAVTARSAGGIEQDYQPEL